MVFHFAFLIELEEGREGEIPRWRESSGKEREPSRGPQLGCDRSEHQAPEGQVSDPEGQGGGWPWH